VRKICVSICCKFVLTSLREPFEMGKRRLNMQSSEGSPAWIRSRRGIGRPWDETRGSSSRVAVGGQMSAVLQNNGRSGAVRRLHEGGIEAWLHDGEMIGQRAGGTERIRARRRKKWRVMMRWGRCMPRLGGRRQARMLER
jgi:hypothetical protein